MNLEQTDLCKMLEELESEKVNCPKGKRCRSEPRPTHRLAAAYMIQPLTAGHIYASPTERC